MAAAKTTEKKGLGKKKEIVIGVIAAVVVVIAIIVAVILVNGTNKKGNTDNSYVEDVSDVTLAQMYRCTLGENTLIDYIFEDGTFDNQVSGSSFATGTYTISANEITLTSDSDESSVKKYVLDGEYLIPEECFFDGEVPEDDTFDGSYTYTSGDTEVTITFTKEGTYTYETVDETNGTETVTGTYSREGNLINRTQDDGTSLPSLYVYNGNLASLYYVETEVTDTEESL